MEQQYKQGITISPELFESILDLRDEFDSLVETMEILNDKELMEGIKRSRKDAMAGKVHELKDTFPIPPLI